ncbi:MAG: rhodanese-like domain-containing protein [Alphaproteobacteria bacterium]|nr:rhodanese-like domain-containing protein [Alphaproteobacteria bacterium]MBF0130189.1 rhodanese-like domain-containing protein [Alphaproteobacteria bacterium]
MSIINRGVIEVDPVVVAGWLENGEILLVDVREEEEWAEERVAGAILSPMSDFEADRFPSEEGKRLVVMCKVGRRSEAIARKMLEHGAFPVYNMAGGLNGWKEADLPTQR